MMGLNKFQPDFLSSNTDELLHRERSKLRDVDRAYLDQLMSRQHVEFFLISLMDEASPGGGLAIAASERMCRETGYFVEEIVGRDLEVLQSMFHTDAEHKDMLRTIFGLQCEEPMGTALICFRKDGTPFINEVAIKTLFDLHGNGILTISHSIISPIPEGDLPKIAHIPRPTPIECTLNSVIHSHLCQTNSPVFAGSSSDSSPSPIPCLPSAPRPGLLSPPPLPPPLSVPPSYGSSADFADHFGMFACVSSPVWGEYFHPEHTLQHVIAEVGEGMFQQRFLNLLCTLPSSTYEHQIQQPLDSQSHIPRMATTHDGYQNFYD